MLLRLLAFAVAITFALPLYGSRPNIVVLLADDLGYGDLGFNGNPSIMTPNLDRMVSEGMRVTNWYSGSPVCSPSRAALLTGRLAVRSGCTAEIDGVFLCDAENGLPTNETTLAESLKLAGYRTGMIGKWHLGQRPEYLPPNRGFDSYFGLPYSVDMGGVSGAPCEDPNCPDLPLFRNHSVIEQPVDLLSLDPRYADEATRFINESASMNLPFFLYVAFSHVHTSNPNLLQYSSPMFAGKSERGAFGDATMELDWVVGEILETLRQTGLAENTVVFFTSDNGPWLIKDENGGSVGPFIGGYAQQAYNYTDTGKGTTWEGGIREPAAIWWPGTIAPGTTTHEIVSTMDIFTTSLLLAGASIPTDRIIDGQDIIPVMMGGESPHDYLFLYRGATLFAVRHGPWKAHFKTKSGYGNDPVINHDPPLLFNVDVDPSESDPVDPTTQPQVLNDILSAVLNHTSTVVPAPYLTMAHDPKYAVCCSASCSCPSQNPDRRF